MNTKPKMSCIDLPAIFLPLKLTRNHIFYVLYTLIHHPKKTIFNQGSIFVYGDPAGAFLKLDAASI